MTGTVPPSKPGRRALGRLWLAALLAVLVASACGTNAPAGGETSSSPAPAEETEAEPGEAEPPEANKPQAGLRVGFDLDDTLLFSSPAFQKGFDADVRPYSWAFWRVVNTSDGEVSVVKKKTREILQAHQAKGAEIFVVTARHPHGGEEVMRFLYKTFGIPPTHVYFETEGKAERLRALRLDVFYGDADSDVSAALEAGVKPVRILRSPKSSYKKKYNPGKYDEEIVEGSEE